VPQGKPTAGQITAIEDARQALGKRLEFERERGDDQSIERAKRDLDELERGLKAGRLPPAPAATAELAEAQALDNVRNMKERGGDPTYMQRRYVHTRRRRRRAQPVRGFARRPGVHRPRARGRRSPRSSRAGPGSGDPDPPGSSEPPGLASGSERRATPEAAA